MAKDHDERIYEALTRRLQPITRKLDEESKTELDGILYQFSSDLCNAVKTVTFMGKL